MDPRRSIPTSWFKWNALLLLKTSAPPFRTWSEWIPGDHHMGMTACLHFQISPNTIKPSLIDERNGEKSLGFSRVLSALPYAQKTNV